MKTLLAALVFIFTLISCSGPNSQKKLSKDLEGLFSQYWEERIQLFPLDATQQGDNRYNHLLPDDQSPEFREKLKNFYTEYLTKLRAFDRDDLSDADKISYDVLEYDLDLQLQGLKTEFWMIPFQQFWGLPLSMGQLGSGDHYQPFKTVTDYKNWLGRLQGFATWTDSAILNFKAGAKKGVVLPKPLVTKMIPQVAKFVVSDPKKSLFYGPIKKMPETFSAAEKKELTEAYVKAIKAWVIPSYKKLHDYLKAEYLPRSRYTHGINSVPGGAEMYAHLVKYWTTTDRTPDEIHQIGLNEVARIRSEMEKVKEIVGYKGDLKAFFEHLRNDPKFRPYRTPGEVIEAFKKIHTTMMPKLSTMFGRTPITPFEIRQTEEFRAESASAEYSPGSPDGTRPGIFYIPIVNAKKFNITSGMESLFLHEAIPGHHYQISLQQENSTLPKFQRFSWYGAYGEGWALYTESLGKELGLYTDPYQYMGALGDEMHRALRLVVDTAIHTKGMTREKAIKYLMENEPIAEADATSEVERYMAIPGQALSYKIGSLKIRELREKYQNQMGSKFKLSDFHDEFLKDGCMPLSVVERKMDDWSKKY